MDKYSQGQHYIDPAFARYDPVLAAAMTRFLYADPTSPVQNDPNRWQGAGVVRYINRTLAFPDVGPGGQTDSARINLVGGRNCIVFAKMITVTPSAPAAPIVVPNQYASYVNVEIKRADGFILTEDQPASNTFGSGQWPFTYPSPDLWAGTTERVVTVTNNNNPDTCDIVLNWLVAVLDFGR